MHHIAGILCAESTLDSDSFKYQFTFLERAESFPHSIFFSRSLELYEITYLASISQSGHQNEKGEWVLINKKKTIKIVSTVCNIPNSLKLTKGKAKILFIFYCFPHYSQK